MSEKPLKDEEIAGLMAVFYSCNGSPSVHVPLEYIRKKLRPPYRDEAKRVVEKLASRPERFVLSHKGRTTSYSITIAGIEALKKLKLIP